LRCEIKLADPLISVDLPRGLAKNPTGPTNGELRSVKMITGSATIFGGIISKIGTAREQGTDYTVQNLVVDLILSGNQESK